MRLTALLLTLLLVPGVVGAQTSARDSWWWDERWWSEGQLPAPANHAVAVREITYKAGEVDVPAMVARPKAKGRYPAVLYQHGRRGLDDLIRLQVKRLAARGFVVLAPDVYTAHFISPMPIEHDDEVEASVNQGVDALLTLPDVSTKKACLVSHTRGGYMTLKVATTFARQDKDIACYVSWYPHWQHPNAPEPLQVYSYAPEVEQLRIPTLVLIGEDEQYQRKRSIESGVKALEAMKRPVRLIVYPGVGRGFDFRPPHVRTFADDLASKDAIQRAADFIRQSLAPTQR